MDEKAAAAAMEAQIARAKATIEKIQQGGLTPDAAGSLMELASTLGRTLAEQGGMALPAVRPGAQMSPQEMQEMVQALSGQIESLTGGGQATSAPRPPPVATPPARPPPAIQARPAPPAPSAPKQARPAAPRGPARPPSRGRAPRAGGDSFLGHRSYSQAEMLGARATYSPHETAQREARRLRVLQEQGVRPNLIAGEIARQLGQNEDPSFRKSLVDEVKPQLEEMASSLATLAPAERQEVLDGLGRVALQVGPEHAESFAPVLSAGAVAEAEALFQSARQGTPPGEVARALEQALDRAPSPTYRGALVDAAGPVVTALARALAGAAPDVLRGGLASLSRAAERLGRSGATALAAGVAQGLAQAGFGPRGANALAAELGRAIVSGPHGASLGVELGFTLKSAGSPAEADEVFRAVAGALVSARSKLQEALGQTGAGGGRAAEAAALLAALLPGAGLALALRPWGGAERTVPERQLDSQSVLVLGALDFLAPLPQGQRALVEAARAQQQDAPTFLDALPHAAAELSDPVFEALLRQSGFDPAAFGERGRFFLGRVAEALGRGLAGAVHELRRGGQAVEAAGLLRSAVIKNTRLFGLMEKGGPQVASALVAVLDTGEVQLSSSMEELERVGGYFAAHRDLDKRNQDRTFPAPPAVRALAEALAGRAG